MAFPPPATTGTRYVIQILVIDQHKRKTAALQTNQKLFIISLQIWEALTQRVHRVIALDFLGFGFSDKPVSEIPSLDLL